MKPRDTKPVTVRQKAPQADLNKKSDRENGQLLAPSRDEVEELTRNYGIGNYDESENLARALTHKFPSHPLGWKFLGIVLKAKGCIHEPLIPLQKAVELSSQDTEALYSLGVVLRDLGRLEDAEKCYREVIRLEPNSLPAHYNLSLILNDLNFIEEAVVSCEHVIRLKPDFARAHYNLAIAQYKLGRSAEAIVSCRNAIRLAPDFAAAHHNLGVVLSDMGFLAEAEVSYRAALRLQPDFAQAHCNLGAALLRLDRFVEAEASYRDAIRLQPNYAEAHNGLAVSLLQMFFRIGQFSDAEASCREAIRLKPDYAEAHSNLGAALFKQGRRADAELSYREAIRLSPDDAKIHNNLGLALHDLGRFSEAELSYREALRLRQDYAEAYSNLGVALFRLGRFSEADACYQEAIRLQPDYAPAYHNKSHLDLLQGALEEGWANNEWRRKLDKAQSQKSFPVPIWRGVENISGKTILVYSELHLGDTIQMCRYLKLLLAKGARVLFAPHRQLYALMKGLDRRIELVSLEDRDLSFDYHCPMMSLPLAFKTTKETIPSETPYLVAEEDRIEKWRRVIGGRGFKIAICWGGSPTAIAAGRTFPLHLFSEISKIEGVRLISIHKGEGEKELKSLPQGMKVEILGDDFDAGDQAFLDTAAVMKCCDLVITSDTAITVLGGALAVPTWIALKKIPHWFWMLDRSDSPWYPSIRLFRQKSSGEWEAVFHEIREALIDHLSKLSAIP